MKIQNHPFDTIDWHTIEKIKHEGEKGFALWQTIMMGDVRIRIVEYSAGYIADHWCNKGHVIYCIKGKMKTELQDRRIMKMKNSITYHVGDDSMAHRSTSKKECKLFIVD